MNGRKGRKRKSEGKKWSIEKSYWEQIGGIEKEKKDTETKKERKEEGDRECRCSLL